MIHYNLSQPQSNENLTIIIENVQIEIFTNYDFDEIDILKVKDILHVIIKTKKNIELELMMIP